MKKKNNVGFLICSHCLDVTFTSVPCESCPSIIYCSNLCKNTAWDKYHKIECSILKYLVDSFDSTFLMRFRTVIIALREKDFQLGKEYEIGGDESSSELQILIIFRSYLLHALYIGQKSSCPWCINFD